MSENRNASRRNFFWKLGAAAFAATTLAPSALAFGSKRKEDLKFKLLFDVHADLEDLKLPSEITTLQKLGGVYQGTQKNYSVTGGHINGPKLSGKILEGGGEWTILHPDGAGKLYLRTPIRTNDGSRIYMYHHGVVYAKSDVLQRLRENKPVDPSEYYFRTTPYFETTSKKHAWLNRIAAVGKGHFVPNGIKFSVYSID